MYDASSNARHAMPDFVDTILHKLAVLVSERRWEELESDTLEIKPTPSDTGSWRERHKSVNAFLNTRGGIMLLGVKEEGQGADRRYVFTGYREAAEEKLKEFPFLFTDRQGGKLDLREQFPAMELREFPGGRVAVVWVDELPADRKYAFYRGDAWKRILTGDHRLVEAELDAQDAYREEAWQARELQLVTGVTADGLSLDALNDYIQHLNRPVRVETMKADLQAARPFLERKLFVKDGQVTVLGMLVCGRHPEDHLGFRCHVHGYVDVPQQVAQDKQDLVGNILPLMEAGLSYILRNIQVGVSIAGGGASTPQYPEEVLRETVNNALAHRDYSINKQAIIAIKPGRSISIRNPGRFRSHLLIEHPDDPIPLRRIIPEAKARNPKLADVLRVYRKWEGRGIGMATLVNLCLENRLDLPTYRLYSEEVCLILTAGSLLDERMEARFQAFDAYLEDKNRGRPLTQEQKLVLAYLMKAEWANERLEYTILLTPDNNHFAELLALERAGLIAKHPLGSAIHPIYVPDRVLMQRDYQAELERHFGEALRGLNEIHREILDVLFQHGEYSRTKSVRPRTAAYELWAEKRGGSANIREFDAFDRRVRSAFGKLEKSGFIVRSPDEKGYQLNRGFLQQRVP
ncbi:MAG: RNA-binding domain-containing protein [Actinomycetota bacterium]